MQPSQGISTVSAAVYVTETATETEARKSCDSCCTCAPLNQAVCRRHGCLATTLKILLFILPVCEMVIGALHYSRCQNSRIPIFLLVLGGLSLPLAVNVVFPKLIREPARTVWIVINFFAVLAWFIAGNVWTFQRFPFLYCNIGLSAATINLVRINYVLLFLFIMYVCLYCRRRQYRVKNQQSGTYIDVNKFYKQNMASCRFTQSQQIDSLNPTITGQQQMWIHVPTEDPRYLPSAPPTGLRSL